MLNKLGSIAGIVKYGVIGGIVAGVSYVAYKIWKEFEKAKPPATDEPFAEIPEGHGLVIKYKTIYVGAWIGWLFPMTNIMNTKSEFIKHLEWVRDTFPKEMKVVECYCIMEDKYEHYLGVAYQILNFVDDLPETTTISEKKEVITYPPIRLKSGEWYQPIGPITQEIYEQNIVEKEAYEEVIESIIETVPEVSQYAILKLTEAEIREQEGATNIIINTEAMLREQAREAARLAAKLAEKEAAKLAERVAAKAAARAEAIELAKEVPVSLKLFEL